MILVANYFDAVRVCEREEFFANDRHCLAVFQETERMRKNVQAFQLIFSVDRFNLEFVMQKGKFLLDHCQRFIGFFSASRQQIVSWMKMPQFLLNFDQRTFQKTENLFTESSLKIVSIIYFPAASSRTNLSPIEKIFDRTVKTV